MEYQTNSSTCCQSILQIFQADTSMSALLTSWTSARFYKLYEEAYVQLGRPTSEDFAKLMSDHALSWVPTVDRITKLEDGMGEMKAEMGQMREQIGKLYTLLEHIDKKLSNIHVIAEHPSVKNLSLQFVQPQQGGLQFSLDLKSKSCIEQTVPQQIQSQAQQQKERNEDFQNFLAAFPSLESARPQNNLRIGQSFSDIGASEHKKGEKLFATKPTIVTNQVPKKFPSWTDLMMTYQNKKGRSFGVTQRK